MILYMFVSAVKRGKRIRNEIDIALEQAHTIVYHDNYMGRLS